MKWLKGLFAPSAPKLRDKLTSVYEKDGTPWAAFEVVGFEEDGRVKVNFAWNQKFITKIKALGFDAETDEDRVQLFFFASSMRPTSLNADPGDDPVQSEAHPQLSAINNELRV